MTHLTASLKHQEEMTSEHKRLAWDAGDDFEGACDVRIGFKTTQHESRDEHWMNKLSVRWTRHEDDIDPGGRISHAEIMLQVQPNVWRRWSIAKMTRITKSDGRYKWMPGTVHCKRVDVMNDDYVYIKLFVHRNQQTRMYQFLMSQVRMRRCAKLTEYARRNVNPSLNVHVQWLDAYRLGLDSTCRRIV